MWARKTTSRKDNPDSTAIYINNVQQYTITDSFRGRRVGNKISGADNTANSTPQNISCESGSYTEQDDADWLSSGGARDYGLLKTATNKTVRFVKYHLPMRLNLLLLIELVCNLEHRNMDMIMFSPNVTHNNYYSDYTYINGIRELRFAQFMERQVQYCCLIGNALY